MHAGIVAARPVLSGEQVAPEQAAKGSRLVTLAYLACVGLQMACTRIWLDEKMTKLLITEGGTSSAPGALEGFHFRLQYRL